MATLTGSEILARALVDQGVETLFFLMGGPMLETESALIKAGVRAIDTHHEQAASYMAHAWGRVKQRPGVCMACSGPGATNLVTGVANAFADAAPLVAIGGSSPKINQAMDAFQEIDQLGVFRPVTKWAERFPPGQEREARPRVSGPARRCARPARRGEPGELPSAQQARAADPRRSGRRQGSRRAPRSRRAPADPRRQRCLVVRCVRRVPALR